MPKYANLSLPQEMADLIQQIIEENPELGYSSIAEFVKDAIRDYAYFRTLKPLRRGDSGSPQEE